MSTIYNDLLAVLAEWWDAFLHNLPHILIGIIIFLAALYLARLLGKLTERALKRQPKTDPATIVLLARLTRWAVITLGIVLALQQAGTNVSAFLTGLGILGFTIGFALQDVSKNFIAGLLLLIQQPFSLGDNIEAAGYGGTVEAINLRDTVIKALDGRRISIPNGDVLTSAIINLTRTGERRVALDLGVAGDSDLNQVRQIALQAISALTGILATPAPQVIFHTFADSSINLTIYYWLDTRQLTYLDAQSAGVEAIKLAFEQAGIEMPYPTRVVHVQTE